MRQRPYACFRSCLFRRLRAGQGRHVKTAQIGEEEFDPAKWGEVFPLQYESWLKTKEPRPKDRSFYKRGWDTDKIIWDKLAEFPFMALLFNGWGFGIEYNEPRGHYFMMIDQREIDQRAPRRRRLPYLKSPYAGKLVREVGKDSSRAVRRRREQDTRRTSRSWRHLHRLPRQQKHGPQGNALDPRRGLKAIKKEKLTRQEMRMAVCAHCHGPIISRRSRRCSPPNVVFPWQELLGQYKHREHYKGTALEPANKEWKQAYRLQDAFIRHPEFEFLYEPSPHFKAGWPARLSHAYKRVGSFKISDHNLMTR